MRIPENMIEFSPLSIKGKKALSKLITKMRLHHVSKEETERLQDESYFLDSFFIEPFTRISEGNWVNDNVEDADKDVYDIDVQKKAKEPFESALIESVPKLLWISGNAGCGKSTYVHRLGQQYSNKVKMIFCDFERIKKRCLIKCGVEELAIENDELWSNSTLFKFLILLIHTIIEELCINWLNIESYRDEFEYMIQECVRNLDYENDYKYVIDFFESLKDASDDKLCLKRIRKIYAFFCNIISDFGEGKNDLQNDLLNSCIIKLVNILMHILLCKGNIKGKFQVCVFDNIEYASSLEYDTDKVLITDRSIEIILNSIHFAVSSFVQRTVQFYRFAPKIIVVTRKATVAFNGNMEGNDYQLLDITNWFCAKEIYEKRLDYILDYVADDEEIAYRAFNIIMSDCTMSKWSLVPFLSKLFNYNIRRMARIILHILIINTTSSENSEREEISNFISMWDKYKEGGEIKHFFRIYIIRLVLDSFNGLPREMGSIQNQAYLNKLMVELDKNDSVKKLTIPKIGEDLFNANINAFSQGSTGISHESQTTLLKWIKQDKLERIETSFTRRILTILHRVELQDLYPPNNQSVLGIKYYNFEDLLKNLLLDGNNSDSISLSTKAISEIGNILYLMNEVTDSTGWVPLTSVKWKNTEEKYTSNAILKVLENAAIRIRNHMEPDSSYGIRITYAGQMFLMLLPEFEYFATRFCSFEPKLISNRSMKKAEKKGNKKDQEDELDCIKMIKNVLYHSIMCSYTVIKRAISEYSSSGTNATVDYRRMHNSLSVYTEFNGSPTVMHPDRIFRRQQNYLNIYRKYIFELGCRDSRFKNDQEKAALLGKLDELIIEYKKWDEYFKGTYPEYYYWEE